jgi:hypothetical protein
VVELIITGTQHGTELLIALHTEDRLVLEERLAEQVVEQLAHILAEALVVVEVVGVLLVELQMLQVQLELAALVEDRLRLMGIPLLGLQQVLDMERFLNGN